jgi:chemotaxis protein CheD
MPENYEDSQTMTYRMTKLPDVQFFLKPGYVMINKEPTLVRTVLGNCVAVTLYDRVRRFGGIHQFVFPTADTPENATPQYGNVGIPALLRLIDELGGSRSSLVAQIIGGSRCAECEDDNLGERNVVLARKVLNKYQVPIVSEDVGGVLGRKVVYHTGTNETAIFRVATLRQADWFLPGMDLRYIPASSDKDTRCGVGSRRQSDEKK